MPNVPDSLERADSPTVLVAEDHADTRLMLRILLERKGYRVVEAGDGVEAVEAARREHPDIVLMDVSLPTLDGLSATRRIHEVISLSALPVVVVSGHAAERDQTEALAAGCSAYLTKPIDFDRLDDLLCHFIPARAPL